MMNHAASNDGNNSPDNNDDDNNSNHPYNQRPSAPLVPPLRYAATGGITLPMGVALQLHHHGHHAQTITPATPPPPPPTAATTTVQVQTIVANTNTATQPVGRIPIHGHGGESAVGIDNIDPAAVQQQQLHVPQHQIEVAHPLPQLQHATTTTPTALALAPPPPVANVGPTPTANDDDILQREAVATTTTTVVDVEQKMHHVDVDSSQPPQNHGQQKQQQQQQQPEQEQQQNNYHEQFILHPQNYQQQYPLQLQLVPPRPRPRPRIPPEVEVAAASPLPMNTIPQRLPIVHATTAAVDAAGFTATAANSPQDQEEHMNMEEEEEEVWQCHKCQRDNLASKVRCSSCQSWKGGKREAFHKKQTLFNNQHILLPQAAQYANMLQQSPSSSSSEEPWNCPCGHQNKYNKLRCTSCQKWKNGRRMSKVTAKWFHAQQRHIQQLQQQQNGGDADGTEHGGGDANEEQQQQQEEWTCDKCGNINAPTKVRCNNCPRWKNGKRTKYTTKKKMMALIVEHNAQVDKQQAIMINATRKTQRGAIGIGIIGVGDDNNDGRDWYCLGCNHCNKGNKGRCGSCQRWKFGKRENMLKKNRLPNLLVANTNDANNYAINATENNTNMRHHQQQQQQQQLGAVGVPPAADMMNNHALDNNNNTNYMEPIFIGDTTIRPPSSNWSCPCGQTNLVSKTRCSSCQKWKGGKRGSVPRKQQHHSSSTKQRAAGTVQGDIADDTDVEGGVGVTAATAGGGNDGGPATRNNNNISTMMMLNQPNMPWKCTKCGNDNGYLKLRCGTCQSWKNAKKQLGSSSSRGKKDSAGIIIAPLIPPPPTHPNGTICLPEWTCHKCNAIIPGTKGRCPSCKSWKNGVRPSKKSGGRNDYNGTLANLLPQTWKCDGCQRQNPWTKVRCSSCQCWRGGQRPDVALRKLEEKMLKEPWVCTRCGRSNGRNKQRCGGCQRWRNGQRPAMRKSGKGQQQQQQPQCDTTAKTTTAEPIKESNQHQQRPTNKPPATTNLGVQPQLHIVKMMPPQQQPQMAMMTARPTPPMPSPYQPNTGVAATLPSGINYMPMNNNNYPINNLGGKSFILHQHHPQQQQQHANPHPQILPYQPPQPNQVQTMQTHIHQPTVATTTAEAAMTTNNKNNVPKATKNIAMTMGVWQCEKCTCDNLATEIKCKICDSSRPWYDANTMNMKEYV